jgi:hypothetical protein
MDDRKDPGDITRGQPNLRNDEGGWSELHTNFTKLAGDAVARSAKLTMQMRECLAYAFIAECDISAKDAVLVHNVNSLTGCHTFHFEKRVPSSPIWRQRLDESDQHIAMLTQDRDLARERLKVAEEELARWRHGVLRFKP